MFTNTQNVKFSTECASVKKIENQSMFGDAYFLAATLYIRKHLKPFSSQPSLCPFND